MTFTERRPIEQGFAPVFEAEILPKLADLEKGRTEAKGTSRKRFAIGAGAGAAIGLVTALVAGNWVLFAVIALVGLVVGLIMSSSAQSGWKAAVSETIMPPVCDFLGDLAYDKQASEGFPVSTMQELGLFGPYTQSTLNHRLAGQWRDTPFLMVQANLNGKGTGSDADKTENVFRGLLFSIGLPGDAPTAIQIARDYGGGAKMLVSPVKGKGKGKSTDAGKHLDKGTGAPVAKGEVVAKEKVIAKDEDIRKMIPVTFDHDQFEKLFEVYAEDPKAARLFLSDTFLDTLIAIGEQEGGKDGAQSLTAGFEGDRFYLALTRKLGFLDVGDIGQSMDTIEDQIHDVFDDIAIIRRIIDRLHGVDADH